MLIMNAKRRGAVRRMARPRKDADAPDARTRIIEAFWELIENNSIFELSVGEVTRAARCNRGTFYYYFHDFDELVAIAIAQLLQDNELITDASGIFRARATFRRSTGATSAACCGASSSP